HCLCRLGNRLRPLVSGGVSVTSDVQCCWLCREPDSAENPVSWDPSVFDQACRRCKAEYDDALAKAATRQAERARISHPRWDASADGTIAELLKLRGGFKRHRVIVGFPAVRPNEVVLWEAYDIILVAPQAWGHLKKSA